MAAEARARREALINTRVPGGKAKVRQNAWGNWRGYIGGKNVMEFCDRADKTAEQEARQWLAAQGGEDGE